MKPQDRWVGLLPLLFFLLRFFDVLEEGQPGYILWACHLSNLTLALGILLTYGLQDFQQPCYTTWYHFDLPPLSWKVKVTYHKRPRPLVFRLGPYPFSSLPQLGPGISPYKIIVSPVLYLVNIFYCLLVVQARSVWVQLPARVQL